MPSPEEENQWMIEYSANRDDEDAIYVGRSNVRKMQFPEPLSIARMDTLSRMRVPVMQEPSI